jgi:hypothetical protein
MRDCVGELVQIDGCEHWWFEDRGLQSTLLVFIDDATGRLMHLQFVASESTPVQARGRLFAYFYATRAYLEAWGKLVAFYSDKHGVFRVNQTGALGGDGMTQFGGGIGDDPGQTAAPRAPASQWAAPARCRPLQGRLNRPSVRALSRADSAGDRDAALQTITGSRRHVVGVVASVPV